MKKWLVFGAGAFGREVYYYYGKENIACFVDNDLKRVGDTFFGKEIISFKQYLKLHKNYQTVIAVRNYQPIERQLLEQGITEYTIYLQQREKSQRINEKDTYGNYLYSPTYTTKLGGLYFIVDCWHHRVIYSPDLHQKIAKWEILDDTLQGPHSIASDGEVYIVDDTDHGEICVYRKKEEGFAKVQTVYGLGFRPHKCIYDKKRKCFYVLLSSSCEIAVLRNENGEVRIEDILKIETDSWYARSIKLIDDKLFAVCRNGCIYELELDSSLLKVINQYKLPEKYAGMNDIEKVGCSYYISVYTDLAGKYMPGLIRMRKLCDPDSIEDITERLGIKGVPYFFSHIDGRICITEIDSCSRIVTYLEEGEELKDAKILYSFPEIQNSSLSRRYHEENIYQAELAECQNIAAGMLSSGSRRKRELLKRSIPETALFYIGAERENLISWYPFREDESILEIVSAAGSVANILCERAEKVVSLVPDKRMEQMVYALCAGYGNLRVDVEHLTEMERYDYILFFNPQKEELERLLAESSRYLKENGKILTVANNRLGENYRKNSNSKMAFNQNAFTKKEIEGLCAKNGKSCIFYYPMPEWENCRMVCSEKDGEISGFKLLEKLYGTLQSNDMELKQIIENHAVSSISRSFFIEVVEQVKTEKEELAINIFSTNRKRKYAVNTKILTNEYVRKTAVFREGIPHIKGMAGNEKKLIQQGIPMLAGRIEKGSYVTKFQNDVTLDEKIYGLCKSGNRREVFRLLKLLKEYIKASSIYVTHHGKKVLRTGYPDMVCQNAFYCQGKLLFFDQEWKMDYIDPEYILYRAVKLLYANNSELEGFFPKEQMMTVIDKENIEEYERLEMDFRMMVRGLI